MKNIKKLFLLFTTRYNRAVAVIGQGTTENYLDYSDPKMFYFWKWQWKLLNNIKIP